MQDPIEDAAILTGLVATTLSLGYLLWVVLGPVGFAGAIAGYLTGASIYLAPNSDP